MGGWVALLRLGFRGALWTLPAPLRRQHGRELESTFADVLRQSRHSGGAGRQLARGLAEIGALGIAGLRSRLGHDPLGGRRPERGRLRPLREAASDLRSAVRTLIQRPAFTVLAVIALAAGIAAGTTAFTVIDAVVLRPLPFRDGHRIVRLMAQTDRGGFVNVWNQEDLRVWRDTDAFDAMLGYDGSERVLPGDEPRRIQVTYVTPDFGDFVGVGPIAGRALRFEDGVEGAEPVILLHHELAVAQFGSAEAAIDRRLSFEEDGFRVIGVMPADFDFPFQFVQGWIPRAIGTFGARVDVIARLRADATIESTQQRTRALAEQETALPAMRISPGGRVNSQLGDSVRVLFGAALLLVLIACANTANLVLAQAVRRRREMAVRAALGAGRYRLIRQSLLESGLLSLAAAGVGVLAAHLSLPAIMSLAPDALTRYAANSVDLDLRAAGFTLLLSAATAILVGLLPALRASRADLAPALAGARSDTGTGGFRIRGVIVVVEVALTLVLLAGASLLAQSLWRMSHVELGYRPDRLALLTLRLSPDRYADGPAQWALMEELARRAGALPEAAAASWANGGPPHSGSLSFGLEFAVDQGPPPAIDPEQILPWDTVVPGYLPTIGIEILRGRDFVPEDPAASVIVNDALARALFGTLEVIGRQFRLGPDADWLTIVGVSADVHAMGPVDPFGPFEMYRPLRPDSRYRQLTLVAAAHADARDLLPGLRTAIRELDPLQPIDGLETVAEALGNEYRQPRFYLLLVGMFALSATVMAALGVFAIISFVVSQSTAELGIRMALGASPPRIRGEVAWRGLRLAGSGILGGLVGAWAAGRYLDSVLFEVSGTDPRMLGTAATLTLLVALGACWAPAARAARLDPTRSLRAD